MNGGTASAGSIVLRAPRHRTAARAWIEAWLPVVFVSTSCLTPLPIWAQWTNQVSVAARVTGTDNASLVAGAPERADIYTSLRPALRVTGRGPNFSIDLNSSVDLVSYARNTQPDRVLPALDAGLKSVVAERLLYFDADANVRQVEADAFGARTDSSSAANLRTLSSYRLSPYLLHEFSPKVSLLARHDESRTKESGENAADLSSHYSVVRLTGKPVPLGYSLEISNLSNDTRGTSTSDLRVVTAKGGLNIAVFDEVVLGAVAGVERTRLLLADQDDRLYGLNLRWTPTPRTELSANVERRFFGHGGELLLRHRTPFTAFTLRFNREPVTATSSLGVIGGGADVGSFLDAILSRNTPDPTQRAAIVQNLLSSRGLQTSFPNAVDVLSSYPQLQTGITASWVYLGARTTTTVAAYQQTLRQLTREGGVVLLPASVIADSRQVGASLEMNYRLAPQTAIDAVLRWSRIRGLAAFEGQTTRESSAQVSVVQNLSLRTNVTFGIQHRVIDSNSGVVQAYEPTSAFAAIFHRF